MTDRTTSRLRPLTTTLALGAALLPPAASAAPDSLATIKELLSQQQYQRAYEQASAAEERYEGNPEFDFAYGLAALESGHYPEAIFALERVVLARPDQLRVRLELGRAHFLAGNYRAAQTEFARVLSQDPPAGVRANIDRFMEPDRDGAAEPAAGPGRLGGRAPGLGLEHQLGDGVGADQHADRPVRSGPGTARRSRTSMFAGKSAASGVSP
ncbi:MAG: tetratricopeptide repeat protein [Gammaproteobacteria bacterium]|nr:tetratricopeptide repeat protein [Gammaproteobacteria bacterium]